MKYTKEKLEEALKSSSTKKEFYDYLGVRKSGACMANIRRRLEEHNLSIDSLPRKTTKGVSPSNKKNPIEYLTKYDTAWQCKSTKLRAGLLALGRKYECEICALSNSWHGQEIKLEIDHIDGDRKNCLPSNLRFLCPNCHSQTETYGRKLGE